MGDQNRNRSYYDRDQGRWITRDDESRHRERNQRDWDARNFGSRSGGQDSTGYPGPFGWTHDPDVEREFDTGSGYSGHQSRDYRDYDRDQRSRFDERNSPYSPRGSYGSYGSSGRYGGNYGGAREPGFYGSERDSRFYGGSEARRLGGAYAQGGSGYTQGGSGYAQGGYPQRDWSNRNFRDEGYYGYSPRDRHENDERGFGQQLREAGQRIARKVKSAFRGPKGYKRSDERIREDVNDRLAQQEHFDPSDIEVAVSNGEVTLTGSVRNRSEKFLAEEIADDVSGVSEVHNQLRVKREQTQPGLGTTTESQQQTVGTQAGTEASRTRNSRAL